MTIDEAVAEFKAKLPGWWYTMGDCSVSADASCGPDSAGPDFDLLYLDDRTFDNGFHVDLLQPATVAEALLNVMNQGLTAKAAAR